MRLITGDCVEAMAELAADSIDAVVCDPPYGLEFMGKEWDRLGDIGKTSHAGIDTEPGFKGFVLPSYSGSSNRKCGACRKWAWDYPERKCVCAAPDFPNVKAHQARIMQDWHEAWAREAFRVLKPGGYLAAFGGTRTYHRLASGIEDAGFEIRDSLAWLYGSGFPKSLDVSKAIDRAAGAEREVLGVGAAACAYIERGEACIGHGDAERSQSGATVHAPRSAPATDAARQWEGWGTALKPAHEPIVLARKPLIGTVAANVQAHGTGALNIDATRVGTDDMLSIGAGMLGYHGADGSNAGSQHVAGRWPANVILGCACDSEPHDPECAVALLDAQSGERVSNGGGTSRGIGYGSTAAAVAAVPIGDTGGASRFFYTAKASRAEREAGVEATEPDEDSKLSAWVNEVLEAAHRGDTGSLLRRVTAEFGTAADFAWSTTPNGSEPTGRSPNATTSITSTESSSTTASTTCDSSTSSRISASIRDAISSMESGIGPALTAALLSRWTASIGISTPEGGRLTDAAPAISERLCELSAKGGQASRVRARRNTHPT